MNEIMKMSEELKLITKQLKIITDITEKMQEKLSALANELSTDNLNQINVRLLDGRNFMILLDMGTYEGLYERVKKEMGERYDINQIFVLIYNGIRLARTGEMSGLHGRIHVVPLLDA